MQFIFRLILHLSCLLWCHQAINANPVINSSPTLSKVTIVTEVLPPYQFLDEKKQAKGYAVDVIHHLFHELKLDFQLEFYPWPRSYKVATNSKNIVIFSIARTKQREDLFHWIGKLYREEYAFYQLNNRPTIQVSELNQLMDYTVGVNRESPNDQYLTGENFPHIERTANIGQTVKMFYEQRVDLLFGSDFALRSQVRKLNFDENQLKKIYRVPQLDADLYIGISLGSDQQLINELQKGYQIIKNDGTILRLQQKWKL